MIDCILYWDRDVYDVGALELLKRFYGNTYFGRYDYDIIDGKVTIDYDKSIILKEERLALLFKLERNVGYLIFPNLDKLLSREEMMERLLINNNAVILTVDEWIVKSIIE